MPTAREWLRDNGYADIAGDIDEVIAVWRAAGKTTRRDWWDVLAGGADGTPRRVGGPRVASACGRSASAKDCRPLRTSSPAQRPKIHPLFDRRGAGPQLVPETDRRNEPSMGGASL